MFFNSLLEMVEDIPGTKQITLGADKGYDAAAFVKELRRLRAKPHVAQKSKGSAIDKRTTRHEGCQVSLKSTQARRRDLRLDEDNRCTEENMTPRPCASRKYIHPSRSCI